MKIELKSVKIFLAMSEETTAFVADVFVNGVKAAYAKNEGRGGGSYYHAYEGKRELVAQAEKYCLTLPEIDYGSFKIAMDLENFIDKAIEDELIAKDKKALEKKLAKKMTTCLLYGNPDFTGSYMEVNFRIPLANIPLARLQETVNIHKAKMKEGQVFWNTNLEGLGIKL